MEQGRLRGKRSRLFFWRVVSQLAGKDRRNAGHAGCRGFSGMGGDG
jgi:hypothetical protein